LRLGLVLTVIGLVPKAGTALTQQCSAGGDSHMTRKRKRHKRRNPRP
jgi:hypothetical protein